MALRFALVCAVVALGTAPVRAQPATALPPSAVVVPDRSTNVSLNPVGWLVGLYGLSVSRGLGQHVALRADANYFRPTGSLHGFEVGVGLPLYPRHTYDGLFFEPGFIVRRTASDDEPHGCECRRSSVGPQLLLGWHWRWDNGVNLAVAFGLGSNWVADDSDEDPGDNIFFNGYLRLGYAF
jgi:hypothetical protein